MKRFLLIVTLLLAAVGGSYAVIGGYTPLYTSDRKILRDQSYRFWECIKFKSFDQAAEFDRDEDKETTARLIERIFRVKPENLDLQRVDIVTVDIDGTGLLASTKARLEGEILNPKKPTEIEVKLYWEKQGEGWELKLRSSLE